MTITKRAESAQRSGSRRWREALVLICTVALFAVACGSSPTDNQAASIDESSGAISAAATAVEPEATVSTEPAAATAVEPAQTPITTAEPTATPEATSTTAEPQGRAILSEAFLTSTANEISVSDGAFLFAVVDADNNTIAGTNGEDAAGDAPRPADPFRIGSITKVFTSLATLTLVDDGDVDLDAPAEQYVSRVPVPSDVTVRDLLQHTSGVYNYTNAAGFFPSVFGAPDRAWSPEDVADVIADEPVLFDAGAQFEYSNTNYMILGVLIEEVTGQSYHQVVRERLSGPLDLASTYVAGFEDGPAVFDPYDHEGDTNFDYTSIETGAWAAGGIVSSAEDLHTLFTALFDDEIISPEMLTEMSANAEYGFGVELGEWGQGLIGHSGGIPGYFTFVRHEPETGTNAFLASTDSAADPGYAIDEMFTAFEEPAPASDAAISDTSDALDFESCGEGAECAVVSVPVDYASPDGDTTEIQVTRYPAKGERIGTLFMNPGGPGGSTEQMIKGIGLHGPPGLIERFDLVGIDPRGTGKSVPINCNTNWEEDIEFVPTLDDGLVDDLQDRFDDFSDMAMVCEQTYGADYLASITTENAARDIETVRIALGGEPLNYVGYSYGTAIGSVYATLFPDSIRSMILDGGVPNDPATGHLQGAAIEVALERLNRSCAVWVDCPVGDVGLLNAVDMVRDELQNAGAIGNLDLLTFTTAVTRMTAITPAMPDVAQGLANALDGDGGLLHNIGMSFLTPLDDGGFAEWSGATPAIICADGWNIATSDTTEILASADELAVTILGLETEIPCDLWPVTGDGITPVNYTGSTPVLVVGNTLDPITPLDWSEQLAEDLGPNATLLTWDGSDHTVVFRGATSCIDDAALSYLIDGDLPPAGTECVQRGFMGIDHNHAGPVVIRGVAPGSAAEEAGLQAGDKVVSENGTLIESADDFVVGEAGSEVVLVVERDDEEISFTMTRGFAPWAMWRAELPTE